MQDFINDTLIQETLAHAKNPEKSRVLTIIEKAKGLHGLISKGSGSVTPV